MKIVIVGCGQIGLAIIKSLLNERHEVLAIDSNPAVVEDVVNGFDVMGICDKGVTYTKLKEAGVDKTDIFIAMTDSDEINMETCFVAKSMGARHTIARIRGNEYNEPENLAFIKEHFRISMVINPEKSTAEAIYNMLRIPAAAYVETFAGNEAEMIELPVGKNSPITGVELYKLRKNYQQAFLVCGINRGGNFIIPGGGDVIDEGDKIAVIVSKRDEQKLLKELGFITKPVKDVTVVGASKTAIYLTDMLLSGKYGVKLIEKNRDKCVEIAKTLKRGAVIINGDGMSQDLMNEEAVGKTDAVVPLTGKDEQNILMSVFANSYGFLKVVPKINEQQLFTIADGLNIKNYVSLQKTVADKIKRYVRSLDAPAGAKIKKLYSVFDGLAEADEFEVLSDFPFDGVPLKNLEFKKKALIASVVRGKNAFVPGGDDYLTAGDRVIVVACDKITDLTEAIRLKQD